MSTHGGVHGCSENHNDVCHHRAANPSVHQSLDELDFERGIWSSALAGDNEDVKKKLLQSHGSIVNDTDKSGYTALHYASRNGHIDVCQTLLSYNADVNISTQSSKATPLHRAAYMGHARIVSLLLDHRADPSVCDCDGVTPLHKAAENNHAETVDILLKAYPEAREMVDHRGRKPIDLTKSEEIKGRLKT